MTTDGSESIEIGTLADPGRIFVRAMGISGTANSDYSHIRGVQVDRSRVHGIVVDAGDGNDSVSFFNYSGLVNLPCTINGGAGDDELDGEDDRNNVDDPIAFREHQSSYAKMVLNGGDGNDRLRAWIGDTTLIGGGGDDQIYTFESWGHNTVIDDPPAPAVTPPPAPADAEGPAAQPATTAAGDTPPATNPAAVPPPFSTAAVPLTSTSVFGHHADDLWDAAA